MPAWLLPILYQYVLPALLTEMVKEGVLSEFDAKSITSVADLIGFMKNLKFYSEPSDFPEQIHKNGV